MPDPDPIFAVSRTRKRTRPTQVSTAVLLLCVSLGIDAVTSALSPHQEPARQTLFGGIFMYAVTAWLTYNIWMGRRWARGTYAVIFGLGFVFYVLSPAGGQINILQSLLELGALYLLFTDPGRAWFDAESPVP